eukprot:superscaffoldBa00010254_g24609
MAATTAVENKLTDHELNPGYTTTRDSESVLADSGELQEYVVDFLEKEIGSDLKSLKAVGDLLGKLREENNVLEKQVIQPVISLPSTHAHTQRQTDSVITG